MIPFFLFRDEQVEKWASHYLLSISSAHGGGNSDKFSDFQFFFFSFVYVATDCKKLDTFFPPLSYIRRQI